MDWSTLLSVVVGGLLALIPTIITNIYQTRERDKDRQEKRKEAMTQLEIELVKTDIKAIEDTLEATFAFLNELQVVKTKKEVGILSKEDVASTVKSMLTDKSSKLGSLITVNTTTEMLLYSLGQDLFDEHKRFYNMVTQYGYLTITSDGDNDEANDLYKKIISSAGTLHAMLRQKLTSII